MRSLISADNLTVDNVEKGERGKAKCVRESRERESERGNMWQRTRRANEHLM